LGNTADATGYGAVNYEYRIGKYEITIGQYVEFLNAVAKSDPYGLYNSSMATDWNVAGILRTGNSGTYAYSAIEPSGSVQISQATASGRPITYVSWFDAARFANWMHNGQGSGSTESGAYTLVAGQASGLAPARNQDAKFSIPTENEWYKAAYYKGGSTNAGYWAYATQSDSAPGNTIGGELNQANSISDQEWPITNAPTYDSTQNYLTNVGAFTGSQSFYGTFDQSGNVSQWNDLSGVANGDRGLRNGGWLKPASWQSSAYREQLAASEEWAYIGFRLASPVAVPEPSTCVLALVGLGIGGWAVRRRKLQRAA